MLDLGIQERTMETLRDASKRVTNSRFTQPLKDIVTHYDLHGSHDDGLAQRVDDLFLDLTAVDTNADGTLSAEEAGSDAYWLDRVYDAIRTNDRAGDVPLVSPQAKATSSAQSKPSATPVVRPCLDLGRRAIVLTCWSGRGARYAFEKARPVIEAAHVDAVMLHTDPYALAHGGGKELNAYILSLYPWLKIFWATYGDAYGPDPSRPWAACSHEAERLGNVESLMSNCEVAWKNPKRGATVADRDALAHRCVGAMRAAAPSLHLSFTTYDGLFNIRRPDGQGTWGGHSTFPTKGFLGEGSPQTAYADQVYIAASASPDKPAQYTHAVNRFGRADLSQKRGRELHAIGAQVEPWMYLQVHSSDPAAICYLAEQRRISCAWAAPGRLDANGVIGLRAAAELARRNLTVSAFQRIAGLKDDGVCGPKTLAALGISAT